MTWHRGMIIVGLASPSALIQKSVTHCSADKFACSTVSCPAVSGDSIAVVQEPCQGVVLETSH